MDEHVKLPPLAVRIRCREILFEEATRHNVAPAYVVAHIREAQANLARKAVQRRMIDELGMKRHMVAAMFGRDLRRVRASVLDQPSAPRRRKLLPSVVVGSQVTWKFAVLTAQEERRWEKKRTASRKRQRMARSKSSQAENPAIAEQPDLMAWTEG